MVITNFQLVFIPSFIDPINKKIFDKQPDWVKDFFKMPLGQIQRLEKELNPIIDPK